MASSVRQKRVAERIKQEVGTILLTDVKDPRIGMVSVVRVKITADLRHATVHVSVLGDDSAKTKAMSAIQHARGYIQSTVASRLSLRFAPILEFRLDESIEKSIRVSRILDEIAAEREAKQEEEGEEE